MGDRGAVPMGVFPGSDRRMGSKIIVAAFTTGAGDTDNTEIKLRVITRVTDLTMTDLADTQVGFGVRTVQGEIQIGVGGVGRVQDMGRCARAVGVATKSIETRGKTAGRRATPLQVCAVAFGAGGCAIGRRIIPVIDKPLIGRNNRVNDKRRRRVVGVAGITTDRFSAPFQVGAMTVDTVAEICNRESCCGVSRQPGSRMGFVGLGGF